MPELPEIERLVRDLRRTVVGKGIVDVHAGQPKALNMPVAELGEHVRGVIAGVDRHGKSAILRLPEGPVSPAAPDQGRVCQATAAQRMRAERRPCPDEDDPATGRRRWRYT